MEPGPTTAIAVITSIITAIATLLGVPTIRSMLSRRARGLEDAETSKLQAEAIATIASGSSALVENLQEELHRLANRITALETNNAALSDSLAKALQRIGALEAENGRLLRRVDELEQENRRLRTELARVGCDEN
jgi:chromosome segregation ATPase